MPVNTFRTPAWLSIWMSASAALFFLLMLTVYSGYSVGAALLLVGGLVIWWQSRYGGSSVPGSAPRSVAPWSREDRLLCWLLLAVFLVNALAVVWHGDEGKYLDQGVRYLLVIPIVYGLRRIRLRLDWVLAGLALGTLGAAGIAWWQTSHVGLERATGYVTSAIPFSDISLTMAFWCLLAAAWLAIRGRRSLATLLLVAGLAGGYAMIAAATRGSLLAVPGMVVLAAIALLRRAHLRPLLIGSGLVVAAVAIAFTMLPNGEFADGRYAGAITEWQEYTKNGEVANNTVGPRLEAWKAALLSIPERPLLGWGHSQYDAQLHDLIAAGRVNPFVATLVNTHNNFIEVWLHQGTLGLVALVALMVATFWAFARRLRAADLAVRVVACCGASLPLSFAAYGLTQVILGRNNGVMFFLVALAIAWGAVHQVEADAQAGRGR